MNEAYTTVIVEKGWQIGLATRGVGGYLPLGGANGRYCK